MNQPNHPGPDPYGQEYDVSYPPQPPPRSAHQHQQPYGAPQGFSQSAPKKSNLPIFIAAGLVLALAIGLTLFFVLRDDTKGSAGGAPEKPGPKSVTKAFFVAVDDQNKSDLDKYTRGEMLDDIDNIMLGEAQKSGVKFGTGAATGSQQKKVDGIALAIVEWEIKDLPPEWADSDSTLIVWLLDEGEGYQLCDIKESNQSSLTTRLSEFASEYESACAYSK